MSLDIPLDAPEAFEKGNKYAHDISMVLAYGLKDITTAKVQETCDEARESYARDTLEWEGDPEDKPDIFTPVTEGPFETLDDCTRHYVKHLQDLFETSSPKDIPTYPHGFVALSNDELPRKATLVLAYKDRDRWKLEYRPVPIQNELGLTFESLRMGDMFAEDVLRELDDEEQEDSFEDEDGDSDDDSTEK